MFRFTASSQELEAGIEDIAVPLAPRDSPWTVAPEIFSTFGSRRFNYPWAGGWSSTNFYSSLVRNLRRDVVPRVVQIQFASPGFIELSVWLAVAAAVRRCVNQPAKTAREVHKTYDEIHRGMQERQLLAFDVRKKRLELTRQELAFLTESRQQLWAAIGLATAEAKAVAQLSPGTADESLPENELGTVKVLLSLISADFRLAEI